MLWACDVGQIKIIPMMNFESSLLSMKRRKERYCDSAAIPLMSIALSEFSKLLPGSLMDGCSRVIRICLSHIFIHFRPTAGLCITCMVCSLHMMPQLTSSSSFFSNVWQCKCRRWRERRADHDNRTTYCCRHLLCFMWLNCGVEICKILFKVMVLVSVFCSSYHQRWLYWSLHFGHQFRRLHMRKARSIRRGNLSLRGNIK